VVVVYFESLSSEYKKKLKKRELTRAEVKSLFQYLAIKYKERKRRFEIFTVIFLALCVAFSSMSLIHTARQGKFDIEMGVFLVSIWVLISIISFPLMYYFAMARVPLQFTRCLKIGYPDLASIYGFKAIRQYARKSEHEVSEEISKQYPSCVLRIEDTFSFNNSNDLVVVGNLQGKIQRGDVVYVSLEYENYSIETQIIAIEIIAIEIAYNTPANEAVNRKVALRIKEGRKYGVKKGMMVYK